MSETVLDKIIHLLIGGTEYTILSTRPRRKGVSNTLSMKFLIPLIKHTTKAQRAKITNTYQTITGTRHVILFDDIIKLFNYDGTEDGFESKCICGTSIIHNHIITNVDTDKSITIGSSCSIHWCRSAISCYTVSKRAITLKKCFNAIKKDYKNIARFTFGKYENQSILKIMKTDLQYVKWVLSVKNNKNADHKRIMKVINNY
jgi:hypothetical protein